MLVLSRKEGQKLLIGNVTVTVLEVHGGRAKLGIDAPKEVAVVRPEAAVRAQSAPRTTGQPFRYSSPEPHTGANPTG